jgi:plasmid stability protein
VSQLLVRGLDEGLVLRLKERAARNGRSLEAEVRTILERSAARPDDAVRAMLDQWRTRLEGRHFSDSSDLVAEDRER